MNTRILLLSTICFSTLAMAQAPAPADRAHFDHTPMFRSLDANHDDKVTMAEWLAEGLPEGLFTIVDADHDGSISVAEMSAVNSRKAVDSNGDGKVTLEEFKAFKPPQPAAP